MTVAPKKRKVIRKVVGKLRKASKTPANQANALAKLKKLVVV